VFKNSNWDIWVHDLERQVSTRVTFDEASDTEQVWSPDGRELAFLSERGGRTGGIHRRPSDGSGTETSIDTDGFLFPQSWSPDGRVLAYTSDTSDIGVLPLTGEPKPTLIMSSRFVESDPAFSPDGRWIAYMSEESGQPEIYVRRFPSGAGRAQISSGGGAYPRWSRSGRELFYRTSTGITAVPVELQEESVRTGQPRALFQREFLGGLTGIQVAQYVFADYDVSPDGTRFVMFPKVASAPDTTAGMVTLVTGWLDDLSRTFAQAR
jgi:Tol biopolymer transport system component